jgi:DNA-binding NtrC family response regulator
VSLTLPALRDRREDIPLLVEHYLMRYCREVKRAPLVIEPAVMKLLQSYHWPGNVRELQNAIERAVVLSASPMVTVAYLPAEVRPQSPGLPDSGAQPLLIDKTLPLADALEVFKRVRVREVLEATGGNQAEAAKLLGLPPSNFSRLIKRMGLR